MTSFPVEVNAIAADDLFDSEITTSTYVCHMRGQRGDLRPLNRLFSIAIQLNQPPDRNMSSGQEFRWRSTLSLLPIAGLLLLFHWRTLAASTAGGIGEVVYAINAGGDAHTDVNGIRFERDPLFATKTDTTASDFGKQLLIGRIHPADMILYQTERYHHVNFGYDIPIRDDGDYVLVLKFCEVYFGAPNMKVFDVVLNDVITVVSGLDIYDRVGRGVAHDDYVSFSVLSDDRSGAQLRVGNEEAQFTDRTLRVDFIKSSYDNPKVNAIYVMKGRLEDVPKLAPLDAEDELFKEESTSEQLDQDGPQQRTENYLQEQQQQQKTTGNRAQTRRPSGPRNPDPYGLDESSTMLPIFIAIVAFIPILFCLCKL